MGDKKARILVIDDEEGMRHSLDMLLSHLGYQVATAHTCRAGIERLGHEYFDVVLTDIVTPEGLGFEVMGYVRIHYPRTRVIAVTAYASQDSAIEALRHGAHDYVSKPFDFDLLHHTVELALDYLRLKEEIRQSRENQALVEELNDGYFILEEERVVHANRAFVQLLRCEPSDVKNRPFSDLVAPDGRTHIAEQLHLLQTNELSSILEEVTLCTSDNHQVTVEIKICATRSGKGHPAVVGICRDVSERKALWAQLIKAEKLALPGEMMAEIAHELNNKLTPILGYSEILAKANLDEESRDV